MPLLPLLVKIRDRLVIGARRGLTPARTMPSLGSLATRIRDMPPHALPDVSLIEALRTAWGNPGYLPTAAYLQRCAALAARCDRVVLECGSGLSTILLALVLERRGGRLVSLEHHPKWHARVRDQLAALGLDRVDLRLHPLRLFDGFEWYDVAPDDMPGPIQLVICDGPPSRRSQGRYGLLPRMHTRLAPDCAILLDDAHRLLEGRTLARWTDEYHTTAQRHASQSFAEVRFAAANEAKAGT